MSISLGNFNKEVIQDSIGNILVDSATIDFIYNDAANTITANVIGTGLGEFNTASNVNIGGVGVFKQKTGADLEFRGINAASSKVSVTLDVANNEIDIDIDESVLTINNMAGTFTQGSVIFAGATGALAEDNANFFYDNTNNRLGIQTTSPDTFIDIESSAVGFEGIQFTKGFTGVSDSMSSAYRKSRGTIAAPTTLVNGDIIGGSSFFGHDGTSYIFTASIQGVINDIVSVGVMPTDVNITATSSTGTNSTILSIGGSGCVALIHPTQADLIWPNEGGSVGRANLDRPKAIYSADLVGSKILVSEATGHIDESTVAATDVTKLNNLQATYTQGSVIFAGASNLLTEDNSNFFWDDTNNRLGIGNSAPTVPLDITGDVKITGKLTVTGVIDPTALILDDNTGAVSTPVVNKLIFEGRGGATGRTFFVDLNTIPTDNQVLSFDTVSGKWIPQTISGGVTDHGALTGLLDDDHTQYLTELRHDALASDNPHEVTFTQVVASDTGTNITAAEAETLTDGSNADTLHTHAGLGAGVAKEAFFGPNETGTNYNNYRIRDITGSGNRSFSFRIPFDFTALTSIELIFAPTSGSFGAGKNVDLFSDYGAIGESVTNHSESDIVSTYTFGSADDTWVAVSLASVFSSLTAEDLCGFNWDNKAVGGTSKVIGILLKYT